MTTRAEHLQWAKDRALEYVDAGDLVAALTSLGSDLWKHPDTRGHPALELYMRLVLGGHLQTPREVRDFINGVQ